MLKLLKAVEAISIIAVPAALVLCTLFDAANTALITLCIAALAFIPFLLRYEMEKPHPRDIMPVVVLSASAVVGRIIFAPVPNFIPVTAIVIVSGIYFGKQNGFFTGAFTALVSNMFFGQGPWTPWQMYAWGAIGYLAGAVSSKGLFNNKWFIYAFGAAASLLYGAILDFYYVAGYIGVSAGSVAAAFLSGLPFNISHMASTITFLALILIPWGKKIDRIKTKYGLSPF